MLEHQRRRCEKGNEFIHFSLKAIASARAAKAAGHRTMPLWEHAEDLGRMQSGEPASVWQLEETRSAFGDTPFTTVHRDTEDEAAILFTSGSTGPANVSCFAPAPHRLWGRMSPQGTRCSRLHRRACLHWWHHH